jgi:ATP-dependent Clp protease ATP-binding subunit ClpA
MLAGEFTAGDGQKISTRGLVVFVTTGAGAWSGRPAIGFRAGAGPREIVIDKSFYEILPSGLDVYAMDALEPAALRNILRLELQRYAGEEGVAIGIDRAVLDVLLEEVNPRLEGARGVIAAYRRRIEPLLDAQLETRNRQGRFYLCLAENRQIACRADDGPPFSADDGGRGECTHDK